MAGAKLPSLRDSVAAGLVPRFFWDRDTSTRFTDLNGGTSFGAALPELANRSVLLATSSQQTTALGLIELDGRARRLAILPPDFESAHLGDVIAAAGIDAIVIDDATPPWSALERPVNVSCAPSIVPCDTSTLAGLRTEWILMTSGTTGVPKMVIHDLASLTAAMQTRSAADGAAVWGTFYDIRRYGGLQIFLRAVLGGASLVLSSAGEPVGRSSRTAGATRRHASLGHAVAMAPRADEPAHPQHRAALRAALRRDRRPGRYSTAFAQSFPQAAIGSRLCLDRGRRRLRCQ